MQPLEAMLDGRRVIVCVGAGGVGKTTVSAALGVAAAKRGKKALVLTVDPARRLANALGLAAFEEHAQEIGIQRFAHHGCTVAEPLNVAMLDVKSTFDRVVKRYARSERSQQAILGNPFYQQASTALAGSQEYMAMQRLYEVVVDEPYDLIVLDTPPSAHALDFLDAPRRMIELFGSKAFRKLLSGFSSGTGAARMFRRGSLLMRGLGRFTSADMFHNLLEFFAALSETFDGFVRGAEDVLTLLHSDKTAFVIVSAPDDGSTHEGLYLKQRLSDEGMNLGAWVLNRVRDDRIEPLDAEEQLAERIGTILSPAHSDVMSVATDVAESALLLARMSSNDRTHRQRLVAQLGPNPALVSVPRAEIEPSSLRELDALAATLTSPASVITP